MIRRWLFDAKLRAWLAQAALAVALLLFFVEAALNVTGNMARQGLTAGFDFLRTVSGFDITQKLIDYSPASTYGDAVVVAVLNTLLVSAIGIVAATVLGFLLGIARLSSNWLLSTLVGAAVEFARNIPLLLFVLIWYNGLLKPLPPPRSGIVMFDAVFLNNRGLFVPSPTLALPWWLPVLLLGVGLAATLLVRRRWKARADVTAGLPPIWLTLGLSVGLPLAGLGLLFGTATWELPRLQGFNVRGGVGMIPELVALALALTTYTAAFISEIVRGGILSVGPGQIEAAKALGLGPGQILRFVVLPQALRVIIPPLTNQYLNVIKNSSFGALIAYPEIIGVVVGTVLNQTGRAIEVIAISLALYLVVNIAVSLAMNWYNARLQKIYR